MWEWCGKWSCLVVSNSEFVAKHKSKKAKCQGSVMLNWQMANGNGDGDGEGDAEGEGDGDGDGNQLR